MNDKKKGENKYHHNEMDAAAVPDSLTNVPIEKRKLLARRRLLQGCSVVPLILMSVSTKKAVAATKVVLMTSVPVSL